MEALRLIHKYSKFLMPLLFIFREPLLFAVQISLWLVPKYVWFMSTFDFRKNFFLNNSVNWYDQSFWTDANLFDLEQQADFYTKTILVTWKCWTFKNDDID